MVEPVDKIMSEIESDPEIDAKEISLDVLSKGLFRKRKILRINGMVESVNEKTRILQIVKRQTGGIYDISDMIVVV
jgi:hypothetical protein